LPVFMSSFYPGQRLSSKDNRCTVRYIGEVQGKSGQWLGVEWDDPARGKHSGTHNGVEYFTCMIIKSTRQGSHILSLFLR
jgi:dynactin complex subunit